MSYFHFINKNHIVFGEVLVSSLRHVVGSVATRAIIFGRLSESISPEMNGIMATRYYGESTLLVLD